MNHHFGSNSRLLNNTTVFRQISFQNGNTLITNEDNKVTLHYNDDNTGKAQRTAIGQRADGTMILLVTDGRTAASLGATHNDIIDVIKAEGLA